MYDNYYSIPEYCLQAGYLTISLCAAHSAGCEVTAATLCMVAAAAYHALHPTQHNMRLDEEVSSPAETLQQRLFILEMFIYGNARLFYLYISFYIRTLGSSPNLTNASSVKENKVTINYFLLAKADSGRTTLEIVLFGACM